MKTIFFIPLITSGLYLLVMTILTVVFRPSRNKMTLRKPIHEPTVYPPVSILKPVKGVDDNLEENLESFYHLDYPDYEIIYAVDDWKDGAVEIIKKIAKRHPEVPTIILATGHHPTDNPKVHKLDCMEMKSHGSILWVTDANVRVGRQSLRLLVAEMQAKKAKLIFSPIKGSFSNTVASFMENQSLNYFTSGNIILLWKIIRKPVVVGKSMLIDRKTIESFGGFKYFRAYLAEDYLIGKSFVDKGLKVSTDCIWITNVNSHSTFARFFRRMIRWARLRYQLNKPAYLSEILLNPIVLSPLVAFIAGASFWKLIALVTSLKTVSEYIIFLVVNDYDRRQTRWHLVFPFMVVAKDLIFLVVYLMPFFTSQVEWRGGRIKVGKNSLIYPSHALDNPVY